MIAIDKDKLQLLYIEQGLSGEKIAYLLGISPMTVYNRLRKLNIPIRPVFAYGRAKIPWNKDKSKLDILAEQLKELRSKYFIHEIASMYGVSKWVIWNLCDKFGIKIHVHNRFREACFNRIKDINGFKNPFYGKHHSEQARKILSEKAKVRYANPENCSGWKGGISFQEYSRDFNDQLKELIRSRDNYTCQLCGIPECECCRKLDIHHIDYNKQNDLPSNLVSLCGGCNSKVNWQRKGWIKYFANKNSLQQPLALHTMTKRDEKQILTKLGIK